MERYTFQSSLSQEELFARLLSRARPLQSVFDQYVEHRLFVTVQPNGCFYLLKTGGLWTPRPQIPFAGTVLSTGENGCVIQGRFTPARRSRNTMAVFLLLALAAIVISTVSAGITALLALLIPAWLLWSGLCWLLFSKFPRLFTRREDAEVLQFIEENLLR